MPPTKTRSARRKGNAKNASLVEDISALEWFLTNGLKSGDVLRKLHHKEDDKRIEFLSYLGQFFETDPSEEAIHGIFEGQLPQALIDIASERKLYKQLAVVEEIAVREMLPGERHN